MYEFYCLGKEEFNKYANSLFFILYDNMSWIAPTGNSYEEDYNFWFHAKKEELQKANRHTIIILLKDTQELVGYFQYSVQKSMFLMEDIQIKELYQGKDNIFKRLYGFVFDNIREDVNLVEAYADKRNTKSIGILGKLGLSIVGENKNGISYHFRGTYADLLNWYKGTIQKQ